MEERLTRFGRGRTSTVGCVKEMHWSASPNRSARHTAWDKHCMESTRDWLIGHDGCVHGDDPVGLLPVDVVAERPRSDRTKSRR